MVDEKPQVYVNVLGGVVDTRVTRGDVDVVVMDWDLFDGNTPTDEEIETARAELDSLAEPHRTELLADLQEKVDERDADLEMNREHEEAQRQRELANARETLRAAGEIE